jgi:hypothetical protein
VFQQAAAIENLASQTGDVLLSLDNGGATVWGGPVTGYDGIGHVLAAGSLSAFNCDGDLAVGQDQAGGMLWLVATGVVATTTTDANGRYSFGNLGAGSYTVQVIAPGGWTLTTAAPVFMLTSPVHTLAGTAVTRVNVGAVQKS